jgi:hypothetical protein
VHQLGGLIFVQTQISLGQIQVQPCTALSVQVIGLAKEISQSGVGEHESIESEL